MKEIDETQGDGAIDLRATILRSNGGEDMIRRLWANKDYGMLYFAYRGLLAYLNEMPEKELPPPYVKELLIERFRDSALSERMPYYNEAMNILDEVITRLAGISINVKFRVMARNEHQENKENEE